MAFGHTHTTLQAQINTLHIRSDGTSQHFKSKETLTALSLFKQECGMERVTWCFRAPYHGKGPWDGVAAIAKRQLRQRILADETLSVRTCDDVCQVLREIFSEKKPQRAIREYNIMIIREEMIVRQRPPLRRIQMHEDAVTGTKKGTRMLFSFSTGDTDGQLCARPFSCWCELCLAGHSERCRLPGWDSQQMYDLESQTDPEL